MMGWASWAILFLGFVLSLLLGLLVPKFAIPWTMCVLCFGIGMFSAVLASCYLRESTE